MVSFHQPYCHINLLKRVSYGDQDEAEYKMGHLHLTELVGFTKSAPESSQGVKTDLNRNQIPVSTGSWLRIPPEECSNMTLSKSWYINVLGHFAMHIKIRDVVCIEGTDKNWEV
jgi:hypothetical protein